MIESEMARCTESIQYFVLYVRSVKVGSDIVNDTL